MPSNPVIFREYDIRGIYGKTLNPEDALCVGAAYGRLLRERNPGKDNLTVNIAFDGRVSAKPLFESLTNGLRGEGVNVQNIGRGPTPMLYFSVFHLNADGGIMITGSHNPPDHNGFKMMIGQKALHGGDIKKLGEMAASIKPAATLSGAISEKNIYDAYVARLVQNFGGKKKLRVAWDAGNGAAGEVLRAFTDKLPGEHILLNEKVDGTFPVHHPDPSVEENMRQLQDTVLKNKLDLGFAFDGDGDRLGVVDNKGRIFWGDQILLYLAQEVVKRIPKAPVIADVKCSQVLFDEIAAMGGTPVMWKTGHSLIKSKMAEMRAPIAGEMSGHIFIADDYYGFDDALYAAARFLKIAANSDGMVADWRDKLPHSFTTPELRVDCSEERKFKIVDEVRDRVRKSGAKVTDIDGVRAIFDHGWWLLRASNTQPALSLRCEGASERDLEKLKRQVTEELAQSGVVLSF